MRPTKQQSGMGCTTWTRRSLLSMAPIALSGLVDAEPQQGRGGGRGPQTALKPPYPIIDTHIHLFDSSRPQGVPYGAGRPPALPEVYRFIAEPLGVVGAIEIEASPWVEDNLWVLDVSQKDPMMVGAIGNLEPDKPEFSSYLERYHRHPLFRGIRYGNLWGRNLTDMVKKPEFVAGVRELAAADLTFDTANPRPDLMESVVRLTDQVPDLRVVLDHLPNMMALDDASTRPAVEASLRELAKRNVFAKISAVPRRADGQVVTDPAAYKSRLDLLFGIFGEDRVVFGSDWPNSAGNWVSFDVALSIVRQYFDEKSQTLAEKYFWKNSVAAYKWAKRDPRQPSG
jgi:L-fuconolactonase